MRSERRYALVLLLGGLCAGRVFGVEGLRIAVECPDIVLSWPSVEGETFTVQYRSSLDTNAPCETLTNALAAASGTNVTFYVLSNVAPCGTVGTNGGGGYEPPPDPGAFGYREPMVVASDGSGAAVPLCMYPPGSDLSGYIIIDPATGASTSGAGYIAGFSPGGAKALEGDDPGTSAEAGFYRVARNDVHLYGLTNGMVLSGTVTIPVEYAVGSTDAIVGMSFYGGGSLLIGADQEGMAMRWDTARMANGTYAINAELDFASGSSVAGTTVMVTVSNVISFPNYFACVYGDQLWVYAETIPYAAYTLDMYEQETNYLGSFWDYSDGNGVISFLWDLIGTNGYKIDGTNLMGVFTVDISGLSAMKEGWAGVASGAVAGRLRADSPRLKSLLGQDQLWGPVGSERSEEEGASSAVAIEHWIEEPAWSPGNSWAVACSPQAGGTVPYYTQQMMLGGPGGMYGGVNFTLADAGCSLSPGNNQYDYAFEINNIADKTNFLNYLEEPGFRHCYFFGDGNASSFGSGRNGVLLTVNDIGLALGNTASGVPGSWHVYSTRQPYRLVFIDACSSAKGKLCEAFGIPAFTVTTNYFSYPRLQARAFVGYTRDINSSLGVNNWMNRSLMLGWFFQDWLAGRTVSQCVGNAVADVHGTGMTMDSSAVVYGAHDLTRFTYTGR